MDNPQPYETLDPENWDEMRALAHRMVDDALTYLQTVRERPVWQPVPEEVAAHFEEKAPHEPGRRGSTPMRNLWRTSFPTRWAPSIPGSGAGIWAVEPSWVLWPTSWLRP